MRPQYHVINGDALREQFPADISGKIIVMRECLVDGPVNADDLESLFAIRANFISEGYGGTKEEYHEKLVTELSHLEKVESNADINLWFEDDLFCQVNFWFIISLLQHHKLQNPIYLIKPITHTRYGFGGLNQLELKQISDNRIPLHKLEEISMLWQFYTEDRNNDMLELADQLRDNYPFILPAVTAHVDRQPTSDSLGRPTATLIKIMKELDTTEFGSIFQEFSERESIYGFGDLQVKKLYDDIISKELHL